MSDIAASQANITVPVDLTNPGQFFACCALLELADRLWPGSTGWFEDKHFYISGSLECTLPALFTALTGCTVTNSMTPEQNSRLKELVSMKKAEREARPELDDEKKKLEAERRELPIVINGPISLRVDWFCDEFSGGSRFKTWAGMQSVLDITTAMHKGLTDTGMHDPASIWSKARGIGLPFNFDSDLGAQGSALDVGFSFDPLAASETTRIQGTCRPSLELLAFIGLQRFRPLEMKGQNSFFYCAWRQPLAPIVAAARACHSIELGHGAMYEFRLLYRTKYLKSFLPAKPFQGDHHV
jgi:CRISPR-associated protein Csb3